MLRQFIDKLQWVSSKDSLEKLFLEPSQNDVRMIDCVKKFIKKLANEYSPIESFMISDVTDEEFVLALFDEQNKRTLEFKILDTGKVSLFSFKSEITTSESIKISALNSPK